MAEEITNIESNPIIVTAPTNRKFNLDSFKSEIKRNSILSTNAYLITFAPFNEKSPHLTKHIRNNSDSIVLRCDSAVLPGVFLLTESNIRRYGYGPVETVPYNVQFGRLSLTWIVDKNANIVNFFNDWMSTIVNFDSKGGSDMSSISENTQSNPYEVGYKDSYTNSVMNIFVYDQQNSTVIQYSIYDAYPLDVQDVPLSWSETNQMLKYSVDFAYTDIKISTPKSINESNVPINISSILESLRTKPKGLSTLPSLTYT